MQELKSAMMQVNRQKGEKTEGLRGIKKSDGQKTEFVFEETDGVSGSLFVEDIQGGKTGWLKLSLENKAFVENSNLDFAKPVVLDLGIQEKPERITAMYLFSDWWTRPAFLSSFQEIPERAQIAFLKYGDRFACLVPMAGDKYKAYLAPGQEAAVRLELTACMAGMSSVDEPVFLYMEDESLYGAVEKAFEWIAAYKGIRRKRDRRLPEIFRYMGWCSWDAFYQEITEEKVRAKAGELREKKAPARWILMDDGWLSVKDEMLYDYAPEKEKFPEGFARMIKEIRAEGDIKWFGVWHSLAGYWGGVLPGSRLEEKEKENLYYAANGKALPAPKAENSFGFFRDWYEYLRREGIDFVKVDGQSSLKNHYENSVPALRAAREVHRGLEGGASYMDGAVINCMGMAMENMLARPSSGISRNSDDFFPAKENGFAEHLLENAYNALYQDELYYCDWDMFWTNHEDCIKHSLLRAISGGPVYFSDKIGDTNPEVLKPIGYLDGKILMMDRAAKPTEDCLFTDPFKEGVLKLTNVASYGEKGKAGGVAVYNLTDQKQDYSFSPSDIWDLELPEKCWVYDYFAGKARLCESGEQIKAFAGKGEFAWYQVLPCSGCGAFLGLAEKYVGFAAVESMQISEKSMTAVIGEQGTIGFLSEKRPKQVFCNGVDVTGQIVENDMVYTLAMDEKGEKALVTVVWQ